MYVHRYHLQEYLERAQQALEAYRMGDPLDEDTTLGPLASRGAVEVLERQVAEAIRAKSGWKILLIGVSSYVVILDAVTHSLYTAVLDQRL